MAWEVIPDKAIPYAQPCTRTLCPALNLIFRLFRHLAPQQQPSSSPSFFTPYVPVVLAVVEHSELIVFHVLQQHSSTIHSKYICSASSTRHTAFSSSEHVAHHSRSRCLNLARTLSILLSSLNKLSVMKASVISSLFRSCAPVLIVCHRDGREHEACCVLRPGTHRRGT